MFRLCLYVFVASLAVWISRVSGNVDAKKLFNELIRNPHRNYNKEVRPVQKGDDTMIVKAGLRLSQLVDLVRNFYFLRHPKNQNPKEIRKTSHVLHCNHSNRKFKLLCRINMIVRIRNKTNLKSKHKFFCFRV